VEYLLRQENNASLFAGLKEKGKSEGLQRGIDPAYGNFGGGLAKGNFPAVHVSLFLFSWGTLIIYFVERVDKSVVLKYQNVGKWQLMVVYHQKDTNRLRSRNNSCRFTAHIH
jgi:hypothetical protein